jgi:hypothetical protein
VLAWNAHDGQIDCPRYGGNVVVTVAIPYLLAVRIDWVQHSIEPVLKKIIHEIARIKRIGTSSYDRH